MGSTDIKGTEDRWYTEGYSWGVSKPVRLFVNTIVVAYMDFILVLDDNRH